MNVSEAGGDLVLIETSLLVTAGFPAETYLGSHMRGGGLFER